MRIFFFLLLALFPIVMDAQIIPNKSFDYADEDIQSAGENIVKLKGVYYHLDTSSKTAVLSSIDMQDIENDLIIPSSFIYSNEEYSVISIGQNAFEECDISSISIPNTVTNIETDAFQGARLTSVFIPKSVTHIDGNVFLQCPLTSIKVAPDNPIYDSRNNCNAIIETSTNKLLIGCKNTVIPNSVTVIGEDAFSYCSLTSIVIPSSVTSIHGSAFIHCSFLTSIKVSSDNPVYDSRNDCNAIIEKPSNTLIAGCQKTIIPNSVTSIGSCAFYGKLNQRTIVIPQSVKSIGDWAFAENYCLKTITFPNGLKSIGEFAFFGCGFISITIPKSVTNLEESAFDSCYDLIILGELFPTVDVLGVPDLGDHVVKDEGTIPQTDKPAPTTVEPKPVIPEE